MHSIRNLGNPAVNVLLHSLRDRTFIRIGERLRLQGLASSAKAICVHCLLENITFPSKDVISMLTVSGSVALAEGKRLRAICWPVCFVVECRRVPDDLEH